MRTRPPGAASRALFNPAQAFNEKVSIKAVRLNLLYGVNQVNGSFVGLQYGAVGFVKHDFTGWQDDVINVTNGKFLGYAEGAYNQAGEATGVQFGLVNRTKSMHGLQVALFNYTEQMYGLQIGVANIITEKKGLPFLPLVNWKM